MERSVFVNRTVKVQITCWIRYSEIFVYNDIQLTAIRIKRIYKTKSRISCSRF